MAQTDLKVTGQNHSDKNSIASDKCFNISASFKNEQFTIQMNNIGNYCHKCLGNPPHCNSGFTISMTFTVKALVKPNKNEAGHLYLFYNNRIDSGSFLNLVHLYEGTSTRYWFNVRCVSPLNTTHNYQYDIRWVLYSNHKVDHFHVIMVCPPKQPDMEAHQGTLRLKPDAPFKAYRKKPQIPFLIINGQRFDNLNAYGVFEYGLELQYHVRPEKITKCKDSDTSYNVAFGCNDVIMHEILAWNYIIPKPVMEQLFLLKTDNTSSKLWPI